MKELPAEAVREILTAMDTYRSIAVLLINKLIAETDQPEKAEIEKGHYYEIQNADYLNGQTALSDNWYYDVHGEHCLFENSATGQVLEVSLGDKDSVGNLDPYFFYNFLQTTDTFTHLTAYFANPFNDVLNLFEELEQQHIMKHMWGVEYRRL